jgi:drug/metabolite transporter (DMT)-like permease
MFMGGLLLVAAAINALVSLMMSPHGDIVAKGTEHVKTTVVTAMRGGAIATLILCALSAWLLFPARRPKWPARDWAILVLLVLLAGSSLYTLIWLQTAVLH